jgi:Mce-associated membrane protein
VTARLRTAALAAAFVLAVGAVIVVLAGLGVSRAAARTDVRTTVLGVARQDAVDFTTYDYQHLQQDFALFAARATGKLHSQYVALTPDLVSRFQTLKVVSQGQVVSSGLVSQSPTTAAVVVAVNDTIHNAKIPKGQVVYDRLLVDLQLINGQWLATQVQPL